MKAAMKVEAYSLLPRDKILLVDVDEALAFLNSDPPPETVRQLYDFGKLMLDQVHGLRASYDSKLTSCLGWGTAILAIMLAGLTNWVGLGVAQTLAAAGTSAAIVGALVSAVGLKSWAGLKWPSEKDWFQEDYFQWPDRLKAHHLIAMLEAHHSYSRRIQKKGYALMAAEYLLAMSALFLGAAVLLRQIP
jgi:hypothetical protein